MIKVSENDNYHCASTTKVAVINDILLVTFSNVKTRSSVKAESVSLFSSPLSTV